MLWWMILACAPVESGGKIRTGPECVDAERPIGAYETTPIGVLAAEVANLVASESEHVLIWQDGTATPLTVTIGLTGGAWFVDSEPLATDDPSGTVVTYCEDRVELDAMIGFQTEDGRFAEVWDEQRLVATVPGSVTAYQALDLDHLTGTFALEPYVYSTDYQHLRAWVHLVSMGPGALTGAVEGQAVGTEGDCLEADPCETWAERVEVATWGL